MGLIQFIDTFDLVDIWREKFPVDRSFTWSNKTGSRQSRIDFWLISKCIDFDCVTTNILTTPLTDHKAIYLNVKLDSFDTNIRSASYWKLNSSLLNSSIVKFEVNKLLSHFWRQACVEKSDCKNWELFKFEISKYFRRYSSVIAKSRRAEEDQVVVKIASLSQRSPDSLSEEERMELSYKANLMTYIV